MSLENLLPDVTPAEEYVHFYSTLSIAWPEAGGRVVTYGDEIRVTDELRVLNTDRLGNCWLDIVADREAQLVKYGEVRFAPGRWPGTVSRLEPGSMAEDDARAKAYRDAWLLPTEEERLEARAAARREYGLPSSMVHTIGGYHGGGR
jgi:hypothetical protein